MFAFFRNSSNRPAAVQTLPSTGLANSAAPSLLPSPPTMPPVSDSFPPRLGTTPIFFDERFTLCLARSYDDPWGSESSLLASNARPVAVWVRNQRDELVAHYQFTTAPIHLGTDWWPGIYSLHVEHPDFQDILCAVKHGPYTNAQMPPLDLLAPVGAPLPAVPVQALPSSLPGIGSCTPDSCSCEPGTGATLIA